MSEVYTDDINDIMTEFLDNQVTIAKIHTEYKEKLGPEHEMSKLSESLVHIFNQYQELYVYTKDKVEFAKELVMASKLALAVFEFKPYELMEEKGFFKKRKTLKKNKPLLKEALASLNQQIDKVNTMINEGIEKR